MSPSRTPLHDWHVEHRGRIVDFAGWSMPVQYSSIVEEHQATREAAGLFDISHMGRLHFEGPHAAAFLDRLLTRPVLPMKNGVVRYGLVTNAQGGVKDDVLVYRLDDDKTPAYLLVVNASNRPKILDWIDSNASSDESFDMRDATSDSAMLALQGPAAVGIVNPLLSVDLGSLGYYHCAKATMQIAGASTPVIVSRTGYTGEDGCELIVEADAALPLWTDLLAAGEADGLKPAGLGARDTLRLEAGMPLYGHELDEEINPFQAGLRFAVKLKDRTFVGSDALRSLRDANHPTRIGLELEGRRVPREGFAVLDGERSVGQITSGTFSPTLQRPIAMAYVESSLAGKSELTIDIRGTHTPARVVALPFYTRSEG